MVKTKKSKKAEWHLLLPLFLRASWAECWSSPTKSIRAVSFCTCQDTTTAYVCWDAPSYSGPSQGGFTNGRSWWWDARGRCSHGVVYNASSKVHKSKGQTSRSLLCGMAVVHMKCRPGETCLLSLRMPQMQIPLHNYHVHLVPSTASLLGERGINSTTYCSWYHGNSESTWPKP